MFYDDENFIAVELTSRNEVKSIMEFTIVADLGSCQQPIGWFDQLDPALNSTQCTQQQVILIIKSYS